MDEVDYIENNLEEVIGQGSSKIVVALRVRMGSGWIVGLGLGVLL